MHSVAAIVLAAGASTRLGQPKQLLRVNGESLVRRAVRGAAEGGCAPIVVVAGAAAAAVQEDLRDAPAEIVVNDQWQLGLGTSIKAGVQHLVRSCTDLNAVVILACDQPFVDAEIIAELLREFRNSGTSIVTASYRGTLGIPALFARSRFNDLFALADDAGAKALIAADRSRVARIEFEPGAIDIDTPADLRFVSTTGEPPP